MVEDIEAICERVSFQPAEILVQYQYVWDGRVPDEIQPWYIRLRKELEDDPKGFLSQMLGLEKAYQNQVAEAHKKNRRVRELEARVESLEAEVARGGKAGEADAGEQKLLELIDRLRKEQEEKHG